jgi:hypothetical protein
MISGKQLLSANDKMLLFFLKNSSRSAVVRIFLKGIGVVLSNDLQSILFCQKLLFLPNCDNNKLKQLQLKVTTILTEEVK